MVAGRRRDVVCSSGAGSRFHPALATGILMINAVLAMNLQPRPGHEGMVLPMFIGVGIVSVVIELLHFWFIEKTLHRDGS